MDPSRHDPPEIVDGEIRTDEFDLLAIDDLRSGLVDILDAGLAPMTSMPGLCGLRSK